MIPSGPTPAELARRRREADAEAARQAALVKQQAAEAAAAVAAQRRYQRERDAAPLKVLGNGTNAFGVPRGEAPPSATIRDLKPAKAPRDLGGTNAAWKQLNCAASITGVAVGSLLQERPDYDEFNFLAGQATSALSGDRLGVECPAAPAMPKFTVPPELAHKRMEAIIARSRTDADNLRAAQAQRKSALDQLVEAKKKLAELKGDGDAAARQEIATLQAQRQALGPLTLKPAPAPPSPGAAKPKPEKPETGADAAALVAKAERMAKEAKDRGDRATQLEAATRADLDRLGKAAGAVEKGEAKADDLLAAFDTK